MRPFPLKSYAGLLVSVRNSDEALTALAGGADVIDVKEPSRGSLGAANVSTVADVVRAVNGRVPVTAAAGELIELGRYKPQPFPDGVALIKIGLAGCRTLNAWTGRWRKAIADLAPGGNAFQRSVAVVYADWQSANSPPPSDVLQLAVDAGCPALLIDTWDKSAGSLFDVWNNQSLPAFLRAARSHNLLVVLAGSLTVEVLAAGTNLRPDLIAVRSAACRAGRNSTICEEKVKTLRRAIRANQGAISISREALPSGPLAPQEFS
jgi:uncharacterized protein (UPF0264 family)